MTKDVKKRKLNERTRKRLIFYVLMIAIPMAQTAFFYLGVNLNSFIMAFQEYSIVPGQLGYDITFAGLTNFKAAFDFFGEIGYMIKNSLVLFLLNTFAGMPLALMFSFYIYKKKPMSGFFKTILFMPQIISGLIFSLLFKYVMTDVYMYIAQGITGDASIIGPLDSSPSSKFNTLLIYSLIMSFGVNIILFSGSMSGIDESIVESAHLEGTSAVQEFMFITLPMIYPTIVSFLIIGMGQICTNQMFLFGMYGNNAKEIGTLGYYLYLQATTAGVIHKPGYYSYGELAAVSIILSLILVPTILGVKRLLNKFGPSEN